MKFIDQAKVTVKAGDGGAGKVSFRHEKFIDRGGPDGGDGGNGGDVIFVASRNQSTLMAFRYHKELAAEAGEQGGKNRRHGKSGDPLIVAVPVGTTISAGEVVLADLTTDGEEATIAKGGRGGFGNAHFISSTRQAPKFAEPGGEGELKELELELKLIADVGLVGLPNAGKSTLLSIVSNARPKIADYPFTTLTPSLGVVEVTTTQALLIADIPGLIEGAAEGKGLGDEFLRHVERTAVLLHLIDATSDNLIQDYRTIQKELAEYQVNLSEKPQVVALTKIDMIDSATCARKRKQLLKVLPKQTKLYEISTVAHKGVKELLYGLSDVVEAARRKSEENQQEVVTDAIPILTLENADEQWTVEGEDHEWQLGGGIIDRFAVRTDFDNDESVQRLRTIFQKHGIMHELSRRGAVQGDNIHIGSKSFTL